MRSHSTYKRSNTYGFTLIEILIVLGILMTMLALGLFVGMDAYRATAARSERDIVVSLLTRARSRALANIDQSAWGVCTIGTDYILFAGYTCTGSGEHIAISPNSTALFSLPVVFSQLAATTTGGTVIIAQDGRTTTITINAAGQIDW
jgi:type II secretory pathway pseudopilin PulG